MSQNKAESSVLAKAHKSFVANHNVIGQDDRVTEIEVADNSKVTTGLDSIENMSENNDSDTVEGTGVIEGPETVVFGNHLLLKIIGQHLDFSSLKFVRSLNSLCKEVVTPQLLNKSRIVLVPGKKSEDELEAIKNLKGIPELKMSVTDFEFGFEKEGQMFIQLLEELSPSLKALELDIWPFDGMPLPSPSIQFPALTTLKIANLNLEEDKNPRMLKLIYASAPKLNAIHDAYHSPEEVLSLLLDGDGSRNWALAPQLKSLTLDHTLMFTDELQAVINFPQTWEALDIKIFASDNIYENIGRLLEANKDSLVSFRLAQDEDMMVPRGRRTLRLPNTFPKLKELSWELCDLACEVSDSAGRSEVNYSVTFPTLSSLSIQMGPLDDRRSTLWSSLIPYEVYKRVKHFRLSYFNLDTHQMVIADDWLMKMLVDEDYDSYEDY